ncbi:threonine synthase [Flavobacteriaceae bacterium UJ101]|nr:threonine synthase [Flavobacteriaceae bacterium UJ101]
MKYYSLNGHTREVNFEQAVVESIAPDKGLFFPREIQPLDSNILEQFHGMPREEIAYEAIKQFVGATIPKKDLERIIKETISFDFPVINIHDNIHTLELFHGPTLAFKDVGARFMARCLGYFNQKQPKKTTVLVATSGDTGGAVADGFYKVSGVDVIILYPKGKVSNLQEKQLTTLGENITAIEVEGSFDDCQTLVKQAFLDQELKEKFGLTSANSINVARWLPQLFYYIFALQQFKDQDVIFSVPSGNFGNICAGMIAQQLGFPIKHFIASNNVNNVVDRYLSTQKYEPKTTISTISNAMDVGDPSNFIRIQTIYKDYDSLKKHLSGATYTDIETRDILLQIKETYDYLMDTHGAIGYLGLRDYLTKTGDTSSIGIFLETAHPAKFNTVIEPIIKEKIKIPTHLQELMSREKKTYEIENSFSSFKELLYQI